MPLKWTCTGEGPTKRFAVVGELDEKCDLSALVAELGPTNVFDLEGIERINSMGVKSWVQFMSSVEAAGRHIDYVRCSPVVVGQLNNVTTFRGTALVTSVMAPFLCPQCDHEATTVIDMSANAFEQIARGKTCRSCGAAMEFDDLPAHYLSFSER